jgi:dephospho-CoA kinase
MTQAPRIVAFVGMSGVGKSEAVAMFERLGSFHRIYFGGLVLEEVKARGLAVNEENEGKVALDVRAEHGMGALAVLSMPQVDAALKADTNVLIDGLYSLSEMDHLRARYGDKLVLVAIHARKTLRIARLGARPTRPLTPAQVEERDRREVTKMEKAGPIALADHHIVNDEGLPELERAVRGVFAAVFG